MIHPADRRNLLSVLRNEDGAAMIEMVFILPIAFLVYLAILYFSDFNLVQGRVAAAADAMATAAARESCLKDDAATRQAIFSAATALLPGTTQTQELTLSSVAPAVDSAGQKIGWSVQWSVSNPGTALTAGAAYGFSGTKDATYKVADWDKPVLIARIRVRYASPVAPLVRILPSMSDQTLDSWIGWNSGSSLPYVRVAAQQMEWESVVPAFGVEAACSP